MGIKMGVYWIHFGQTKSDISFQEIPFCRLRRSDFDKTSLDDTAVENVQSILCAHSPGAVWQLSTVGPE